MVRAREVSRFRKKLLEWFRQFQRELPWRRNTDAYGIWLSEIMLQQTRVAAAIPYYERFLEHFPTVQALAKAREDEVLQLWAGLGYYSRARNLQKAAQQIVAKHGGAFPRDPEDALALPGIGNYTTAAILSIAYGQSLAVLDGNVARVLARIDAIRGDLRTGAAWQKLQATADELLATDAPGDWNQAVMELGATICTPRAPQCLLCPVNEFCEARRLGLAGAIPEKRKKRETVDITLAAVVFLDGQGRTFLLPPPKISGEKSQGDVAMLLSRMWHFPTVLVKEEAGRELRQHLQRIVPGIRLAGLEFEALKTARHAVTYRHITMQPFLARTKKLPKPAGAKVVALDDVSSVAISNLTRKVAQRAVGE